MKQRCTFVRGILFIGTVCCITRIDDIPLCNLYTSPIRCILTTLWRYLFSMEKIT